MMSLLPYTCVNGLVPPNLYEDPFGLVTHRVIPARGRCVVVAIARNCGSTSNVFCRKIDNSGSGEGDPFQLRKSENRSFWTNEEVTNERLKFGCLLEYRVVTCHQSLLGRCSELGEQDGKQFIFHRNAGTEPQNVDKILLDLQDDESVHGGLQEALEYYNQKDVNKLLKYTVSSSSLRGFFEEIDELLNYKSLLNAHREPHEDVDELLKCKFSSSSLRGFFKDIDELLNYGSLLNAHREPHEDVGKQLKCKFSFSYLRDVFEDMNKLVNYESLLNALRELHEDMDELLKYESLLNAHREPHECVDELVNADSPFYTDWGLLEDMDVEAWDLQYDKSVDGGLEEAQGYVNQEFQGLQAHLACNGIFFLGIRAGMINNERVTLETMNGEWLEMPLNCRESLVLSTGPVHLQLNRPWDVADDDVGGVAVVKYEAGEATCEGLILRYKPLVISRDEEPVEMKNAFGEVIPVRGCRKVLFDTGNEVGTGISRELLLKLNLQPDPNKKKKVELIGEESHEFETIQIELIVRGHRLGACGLVDAVSKDTNLLVGMDVIQPLYDLGYTIGN